MAQVLLLLVVALTIGVVVFGVMVVVGGGDPGLRDVEPDGRGVPLPGSRPLVEQDVTEVIFDLGRRGYRMDQVDRALRRVAYDIGYKDELINVLTAEVEALRDDRVEDADALRAARLAALGEGATPQAAEQAAGQAPDQAAEVATAGGERAFEEVPDGPFAPWPSSDVEHDRPTDSAPAEKPEEAEPNGERAATEESGDQSAGERATSDGDRVVSRG
jgi:DivIVA domain-containing protein